MENDSITDYNGQLLQRLSVMLPSVRQAVSEWMTAYEQRWESLPVKTVSENILSEQPNIAQLQLLIPKHGDMAVKLIIMHALKEVRDFFNVGKNMTNPQITITAELIMSQYWYFKIEDIKLCLRRAMMRENLFDRLDGNIILGWLREYDNERTEEAMRISENEESQERCKLLPSPGAMSYREWLDNLEERALTDQEAATLLEQIKNAPQQRLTLLSSEERAKKDHDFKMWKQFDYLLKKG